MEAGCDKNNDLITESNKIQKTDTGDIPDIVLYIDNFLEKIFQTGDEDLKTKIKGEFAGGKKKKDSKRKKDSKKKGRKTKRKFYTKKRKGYSKKQKNIKKKKNTRRK